MRGRLLFCEPMGRFVRLDGVVADGWSEADVAGAPFTIELAQSETPWMAQALVTVLQEWADDGALIDLEISDHEVGSLVRLHDGVSTVSLPLARHVV
ncbi:MAG: hypothetical protein ACR2H3_14720 [Acidimicrobiales bacterium]